MNAVRSALFVSIIAVVVQCSLLLTSPPAAVDARGLLVDLAPAVAGR